MPVKSILLRKSGAKYIIICCEVVEKSHDTIRIQIFMSKIRRGESMRNPIFDENDGIDEQECLTIYDNSYDFYAAVLKAFVKEGKKIIDGMEQSYRQNSPEDYRILVHGLKSSAASVGCRKLSKLASESNELCKAGDWEGAKKMHEQVSEGLRNLTELIENRLERE